VTAETWETLVRELESMAVKSPRRYRRRVAARALLGYAFIAATLGGLVVLSGGVVVLALVTVPVLIKFAFPLLAVALAVARGLWFRIPEPDGVSIGRDEAPELWRTVDAIRKRLKAPRVHRILVDAQLNAGVVQIPRLGPLGWNRNFLIVGLPMLEALSPEHLSAVLAHELGHMSANHGRFAGWVYRLRKSYARILDTLDSRGSAAYDVFQRFFEWYSPYFAAWSFPLARQDEFLADTAAVEVVGRDTAASALVRVEHVGLWLGYVYWPSLFARQDTEPEPPRDAYSALAERLGCAGEPDGQDHERILQAALARETDVADTHPALADRLAAIGADPSTARERAIEPPVTTAADELLGASADRLRTDLDQNWAAAVDQQWRNGHDERRGARERLAELRSREDELTREERLELGDLLIDVDGFEAALPVLRRTYEQQPGDPVACFALGRALLGTANDEGLGLLEHAAELDEDAELPACELAVEYLADHDRQDEAERWLQRGRTRAQLLDAAAAERANVAETDDLEPHGLTADELKTFQQALTHEPAIKEAFLARKVLHVMREREPVFLLGLRVRRRALADDGGAAGLVNRVVNRIEGPGRVIVITLAGKYKPYRRRLEAIANSRLM
jgi:Zn-dependent protease with chaperone function